MSNIEIDSNCVAPLMVQRCMATACVVLHHDRPFQAIFLTARKEPESIGALMFKDI